MGQAARWMLDRDGPFRLRPRFDPRLLQWLRLFRANCTAYKALKSTSFLRDRVRENTHLVEALANETSRSFGFRANGLIALFTTEKGLVEGLEGAANLRALGIPSEPLDATTVMRLEPQVTARVVGGILYPEDAHLDPGEFVGAVADVARSLGARIEERTPVVRLHGSHGVDAIETPRNVIRPELVVLANGAWSPGLAHCLGLTPPIEPGKGYSLTYPVGSELYKRPLRLYEARTVVSSIRNSVRITSKLDLVGLDTQVRERRVRASAHIASRYVALPTGVEQARAWAGLRPLTPDGLPIIGTAPGVDNLVLAIGHGHLGMSLSAVTASAVARIAAGEPQDFDAAPVSPERFS